MFRTLFAALVMTATVTAQAQSFQPPGAERFDRRDGVRVGATVYTRSGYTAVVKGIFMNGDIAIQVGYTTMTVNRENLATEGCRRGLCSNETVTTRSGYTAVVKGFFINGDLALQVGYTLMVVARENVSQNRGDGYGRLQVGETVYTRSGYTAVVKGTFSNGDVSLQVGYTVMTVARENIASSGCYRGLCTGSNVTTRSGYNGVLKGFFPGGREAAVQVGYTVMVIAVDNLGRSF